MDISISPAVIKKSIVAFLRRFHIMIFAIIALGGSAIVIFILNSIIILSTENTGYNPVGESTTFDQATIKRIEELRTRDQSGGELDLSSGRTNPFVE